MTPEQEALLREADEVDQDVGARKNRLIVVLARELRAALADAEIATKALDYCSVQPGYLHPLNNAQHVVASNALAEIRSRHAIADAARREGELAGKDVCRADVPGSKKDHA